MENITRAEVTSTLDRLIDYRMNSFYERTYDEAVEDTLRMVNDYYQQRSPNNNTETESTNQPTN